MRKRTPDELFVASNVVRTFERAGYELFPLKVGSKEPRDRGFLLHDYRGLDWHDWLKQGGNVGLRARAVDLILDIDPKNGGLVSFDTLTWDLGLKPGWEDAYPIVHTGRGNGGRHVYMRLPEGGRWRWKIKQLPGLDFQTLGRYVVCAGSLHPDTGKPYWLEGPNMAFWDQYQRLAPEPLLEFLKKPPRPPKTGEGGYLAPSDVAFLLSFLDPHDFGTGGPHHDEWLDIGMACHHATGGEAFEEWAEWCAADERYGDDARAQNTARWDSFDSSRSDGITYKTLCQAVVRAGHPEAVARLEQEKDVKRAFSDDAADEYKAYLDGDGY
jgi:hypothetical protein